MTKQNPTTNLPRLTGGQIQAWANPRSYSRGQSYARSNAIVNPRIQGSTLKADCWGSADAPYHVEVTLDEHGIVAGYCSCPVGTRCKHAVALLLTWMEHPESFLPTAGLDDILASRSREDLIRTIHRVLDRYPEVESLVLLPLPGENLADDALDATLIRRQVKDVLEHVPYEWGASYAAAGEIAAIAGPAREYARAGDWRNAAVIYSAVVDAVLDEYEGIHEEEGEYLAVVDQCAEGLADCLAHAEETSERQHLLETLFRIWQWDIDFGGAGIGEGAGVTLVAQTATDEKAWLVDRVRALLPTVPVDEMSSHWQREEIGGLWLQLEEGNLDDETYLRICRETSRSRDLVARLLALGRIDEAAEAVRRVTDYTLLMLADLFLASGHDELFAGLIRERIDHSRDTRLLAWLIDHEMKAQHYLAALKLARQLFRISPDLVVYREVRAPAQKLDIWAAERTSLLADLKQRNAHGLRAQIFLEEGENDLALEALAALQQYNPWAARHTSLTVARAVETTHPQSAIEIYLEVANNLIAQRGRNNYAGAAELLTRVRDLLQQAGQIERWAVLIAQIREENRRLPALKDELKRAGL